MIPGSLADLRVLEVHADIARYTGRLFAEAGADVVKVECRRAGLGAHAYAEHAPVLPRGEPATDAYLDMGKQVIAVDCDTRSGAEFLAELIGGADVLITSLPPAAARHVGLDAQRVRAAHPSLIYLAATPFGLTGPLADAPATDLTTLAAGGFLSLSGNDHGAPIRPFGDQSAYMAALHAWIAVLVALLARDSSGEGALVDVSAQQAVVHSLENAIQYYDLEGVVRSPRGSAPMEAGTGIYPCKDGYVYMVGGMAGAALGWSRLVAWMTSGGDAFAGLNDDRWGDSAFRTSASGIAEFAELFERFAGERTRATLYDEGQTFGVSICPILAPSELAANPQLAARGYFEPVVTRRGDTVLMPGSPLRVETDAPVAEVGSRQTSWLRELGEWTDLQPSQIEALIAVGAVRL
jgi:benzylsuccinate CoA-transferase BbsE subunit